MMNKSWILVIAVLVAQLRLIQSVLLQKVTFCIPREDDIYYKKERYCQTLSKALNGNIECILAVDKMDCIRRIQKNEAQFGVFSSEDLLTARWYGVDLLVVSQIKYSNTDYEYEMVAVVDNDANINTVHDLKGKKLCHPGHGLTSEWTSTISNYLESVVTTKDCEESLTLYESRIKASADFFGPSCKAGPWEEDKIQDKRLKSKYPKLCQLCNNRCEIGDKHWGRQGSLNCLTNGGGDIAWARLDDTRIHFELSDTTIADESKHYSFLCIDGHLQPLNSKKPCIWLAKPWPVIAAKPKYAELVQHWMDKLLSEPNSQWSGVFLSLLEDYYVNITNVDLMTPINDYLMSANGYESAYSFHQCNPSRSITVCTTSIVEFSKCSWLEFASETQGIEPSIQCVRRLNLDQCISDVQNGAADVVRVLTDNHVDATKNDLKPILYEYTNNFDDQNIIVGVSKHFSAIKTLEDLRGKKVCIGTTTGLAAIYSSLKSISSTFGWSDFLRFFSENSCIAGINRFNCKRSFNNDADALECLNDDYNVAFVSQHSVQGTMFESPASKYNLICPEGFPRNSKNICYFKWFLPSAFMVKDDISQIRRKEIFNTFKKIDKIFGRQKRSQTDLFKIYAEYEKIDDILFFDSTNKLIEVNGSLPQPENFLDFEPFYALLKKSEIQNNSRENASSFLCVVILVLMSITIFD